MSDTRAPSAPTAGVDLVEFVTAFNDGIRKAVTSPGAVRLVQQANAVALAVDEALRPVVRWMNENRGWLVPLALAIKETEDARLLAEQETVRAAAEEAEWASIRAAGPPIEVVDSSEVDDDRPPRGRGGYRS